MFTYSFRFSDDSHEHIAGALTLDAVSLQQSQSGPIFRSGQLSLEGGRCVELTLAHSPSTASFMYLQQSRPDSHLFDLLGLRGIAAPQDFWLPGQVILGAPRAQLIGHAIRDALSSPALRRSMAEHTQDEIVVLPVLREGAKYQVSEALFDNYGYYCDEALLDSHHVYDPTVPRYNRRVETTILKDQDISPQQRESKRLAVIGDSIASGIVMLGVLGHLQRRFENVTQAEIIAPFATLRGLARLAHYGPPKFRVRVHVFETLLNALAPDYYYSAHFPEPEFHIVPELEVQYRDWWGKDAADNAIADTACAGYGWAEAFFNPRKQIHMIDEQLMERHGLTIADIVRRNLTAG